jgi:hypothetical protein
VKIYIYPKPKKKKKKQTEKESSVCVYVQGSKVTCLYTHTHTHVQKKSVKRKIYSFLVFFFLRIIHQSKKKSKVNERIVESWKKKKNHHPLNPIFSIYILLVCFKIKSKRNVCVLCLCWCLFVCSFSQPSCYADNIETFHTKTRKKVI